MNWAKQGVLFKLRLCKTVQFQSTYFYRTARLWNTLPFVIRDASSLQIFKKNLNELYLTMVNLFDVNNRCTWSLACACVNCRIKRNILCLKLPVQFESAVRRLFELSPATHD